MQQNILNAVSEFNDLLKSKGIKTAFYYEGDSAEECKKLIDGFRKDLSAEDRKKVKAAEVNKITAKYLKEAKVSKTTNNKNMTESNSNLDDSRKEENIMAETNVTKANQDLENAAQDVLKGKGKAGKEITVDNEGFKSACKQILDVDMTDANVAEVKEAFEVINKENPYKAGTALASIQAVVKFGRDGRDGSGYRTVEILGTATLDQKLEAKAALSAIKRSKVFEHLLDNHGIVEALNQLSRATAKKDANKDKKNEIKNNVERFKNSAANWVKATGIEMVENRTIKTMFVSDIDKSNNFQKTTSPTRVQTWQDLEVDEVIKFLSMTGKWHKGNAIFDGYNSVTRSDAAVEALNSKAELTKKAVFTLEAFLEANKDLFKNLNSSDRVPRALDDVREGKQKQREKRVPDPNGAEVQLTNGEMAKKYTVTVEGAFTPKNEPINFTALEADMHDSVVRIASIYKIPSEYNFAEMKKAVEEMCKKSGGLLTIEKDGDSATDLLLGAYVVFPAPAKAKLAYQVEAGMGETKALYLRSNLELVKYLDTAPAMRAIKLSFQETIPGVNKGEPINVSVTRVDDVQAKGESFKSLRKTKWEGLNNLYTQIPSTNIKKYHPELFTHSNVIKKAKKSYTSNSEYQKEMESMSPVLGEQAGKKSKIWETNAAHRLSIQGVNVFLTVDVKFTNDPAITRTIEVPKKRSLVIPFDVSGYVLDTAEYAYWKSNVLKAEREETSNVDKAQLAMILAACKKYDFDPATMTADDHKFKKVIDDLVNTHMKLRNNRSGNEDVVRKSIEQMVVGMLWAQIDEEAEEAQTIAEGGSGFNFDGLGTVPTGGAKFQGNVHQQVASAGRLEDFDM